MRIGKRSRVFACIHVQLAEIVHYTRDFRSRGRTVGHTCVALYHEADIFVFAAHVYERRLVIGGLHILGHIILELGDIVPLAAFAVQSAGAENVVIGSQYHDVVGGVVECGFIASCIGKVETAARCVQLHLQVMISEAVHLNACTRKGLEKLAVGLCRNVG